MSEAAEDAEPCVMGDLSLSEAAGESPPVQAAEEPREVIGSCHCLVSTASHGCFCCRENDANRFLRVKFFLKINYQIIKCFGKIKVCLVSRCYFIIISVIHRFVSMKFIFIFYFHFSEDSALELLHLK